MNDMGKRKFEDAFKDAFQDAELTPTEKVWNSVARDLDKTSGDFKAAFLDAELAPTDNVWRNVELDLERAAGDKMRRRLLFYKMLAAASVAFAMCMAGVGYYSYNLREQGFTAGNNQATHSNEVAPLADNSSSNQHKSETASSGNEDKAGDAIADNTSGTVQSSDVLDSPAESEKTIAQNRIAANDDVNETSANKTSRAGKPSTAANTPVTSERTPGLHDTKTLKQNAIASTTLTPSSKAELDKAHSSDASLPKLQQNTLPEKSIASENEIADATTDVPEGRRIRDRRGDVAGSSVAVAGLGPGERKTGGVVNASSGTVSNSNDQAIKSTPNSINGNNQDRYALKGEQRPLSPIVVVANAKLPEQPQSNADPFKLMMLRLDDEALAMEVKAKKDKKNKNAEQLWTSVGMTAGTYNTVNRSISDEMAASAVKSATSQVKASGLAYSFGVSVGTKVSERWVVQGGVNYLNQMSDYTSNIVVNGGGTGYNALTASNAAVLNMADENETRRDDTSVQWGQTPPFGISSTMQFISIPVEAGYLVVNKKVGVMLNAGVSTDLFLQNTESANVDGAAKSVQTQERGSADSPYRDVNFIGLVGTEVSYKVGQRYRVALIPGLRYPFNSMYKSDSQIQATPVTFDVGLKFRYIFQ
jgi:hypothetical protein